MFRATVERGFRRPELAKAYLPRRWRVGDDAGCLHDWLWGQSPQSRRDGVGVGARAREPRSGWRARRRGASVQRDWRMAAILHDAGASSFSVRKVDESKRM